MRPSIAAIASSRPARRPLYRPGRYDGSRPAGAGTGAGGVGPEELAGSGNRSNQVQISPPGTVPFYLLKERASATRLAGALEHSLQMKQNTVKLPKYQALYLDQLIRDFEIAPVKESEELAGLVHGCVPPRQTTVYRRLWKGCCGITRRPVSSG